MANIPSTPLQLKLEVMKKTREVFLYYETSQSTIEEVIFQISYLIGLKKAPVKLRLCSPGGSVDAGLALYDFIKKAPVPIHTQCDGMSASMAAVLLAGGKPGNRFAYKNSRIMIHQPSSGFIGKASDIEIHAKETARIKALLNNLLSSDTGQSLKKIQKDMELDYWMTAKEALNYGIIDKIL